MKTFSQFINEEYQFKIRHNQLSKKVEYKYSPKSKDELIEAIKVEIKLQGHEADLNCIDTSKITDMSYLFNPDGHNYVENFNGDISTWNVGDVKNMNSMFLGAESFNGDIGKWDVSNVKYMNFMFEDAKNFNQDISNWDVSKVEYMTSMFRYAKSFNQNIGNWDISSALSMERMFWQAKSFNQDISGWDVSNVKYYNNMFDNCPIKEEYKPKFKKQ